MPRKVSFEEFLQRYREKGIPISEQAARRIYDRLYGPDKVEIDSLTPDMGRVKIEGTIWNKRISEYTGCPKTLKRDKPCEDDTPMATIKVYSFDISDDTGSTRIVAIVPYGSEYLDSLDIGDAVEVVGIVQASEYNGQEYIRIRVRRPEDIRLVAKFEEILPENIEDESEPPNAQVQSSTQSGNSELELISEVIEIIKNGGGTALKSLVESIARSKGIKTPVEEWPGVTVDGNKVKVSQ